MSRDAEEILGAVLFATMFAVAGFFIGGAVLDGSWNSALLRRGLGLCWLPSHEDKAEPLPERLLGK